MWTDDRIDDWARGATCPATGRSVRESWRRELAAMRPLPLLPEPFDVAVTRRVGHDCLVAFEGHHYAVPFRYADRRVEVRGCAGAVQIWADGRVLKEYPRHTEERLLMDPDCFEGEATDPQPIYGFMNWFLNTDRSFVESAPEHAVIHAGAGVVNRIYVDGERHLVLVVRWLDGEAYDGFIERVAGAVE